jgi:crotonobetainyl-CoA:carnitine CoA-transferase CaiB-like acyl-CoA transferase
LSMVGALEGIKVLEMALQYPGPYCSMLLAGLGAEVIKVERPPTGDAARRRPSFFDALNRGKQSIALDLKSPAGRHILHRLAAACDVVTEGFRPGVAARLGIDYPTLKAVNPRLIYCSITGYGQDGPYSGLPGHDLNYMALSGMLESLTDAQGHPILPGVAVADLSAGMFAAIGILAGLHARSRTGVGRYVDVSMLGGLVSWMGANLSLFAATGETERRRDAGYGLFSTADGRLIALGIAYEDWFWDRLCKALGLEQLAGIPSAERVRRRSELIEPLQEALLRKTRAEWLAILEEADVPATPVQSLPEVLEDRHLQRLALAQIVTDAQGRRSVRSGFPMKFSTDTAAPPTAAVPSLGQHTGEVLRWLGCTEKEIERLRNEKAVYPADQELYGSRPAPR